MGHAILVSPHYLPTFMTYQKFHVHYLLGDLFGIIHYVLTMRGKCRNTEFFLVHLFPYSDWIQQNTDQKKLRKDTFHTAVCKNFRKTLTPDSSMYVCVPRGKKLSFTDFFTNFLNEWSLVYMVTANNRNVCFYALQFHSYIHLMPLTSFMQLNLNLIILSLGPCNKINDINLILRILFF